MNRIRDLRQAAAAKYPAGFTVMALAQRIGVAESTLRTWEAGTRRPTARHARKLARELGVNVADLGLDQGNDQEPAPE